MRCAERGDGGHGSILSFTPDIGSVWMPMLTFVVYLAVNWWATWYPGAEPGGGGYIAQRILCAKDEKNSLLATLWFNIAHYAVRPWPWILTALCSLVLYPVPGGQGIRLYHDDHGSRSVSRGAARIDDRRFCGGLHVHHRNAAELGCFLPRERFLPAVPAFADAVKSTMWRYRRLRH